MTISNMEIDFDMDIRKDHNRFVKAYAALKKKQEKGAISDEDMETFLTGCLKPDEVKTLLADGRVSTLAKVFVDFFSGAVEQYGDVAHVYSEAAEKLADMKERSETVARDYMEIDGKIKSIGLEDKSHVTQ